MGEKLTGFASLPVMRYNEDMNVIDAMRKLIQDDPRSLYQLAKDAGLRYSVVHPLATGARTGARASTLEALAAAMGYELRLVRKARR